MSRGPSRRATRSPVLRILGRSFARGHRGDARRLQPHAAVARAIRSSSSWATRRRTQTIAAHARRSSASMAATPSSLSTTCRASPAATWASRSCSACRSPRSSDRRMPVTLQLMLVSILLTVFVAVPLAVYVALHPSGRIASLFLDRLVVLRVHAGVLRRADGPPRRRRLAQDRAGGRASSATCRARSSTCGCRRWSSASPSCRSSPASSPPRSPTPCARSSSRSPSSAGSAAGPSPGAT